MNKKLLVLTLTLTTLGSVMSVSAQPRQQQCVRINQIDSFSSIRGDERHLIVVDRFRNRHRLTFNGRCDSVDFNGALAIRSRTTTGLSCVSRGDFVVSRDIGGRNQRCVITNVEPYTPRVERADHEQVRDRYRKP